LIFPQTCDILKEMSFAAIVLILIVSFWLAINEDNSPHNL